MCGGSNTTTQQVTIPPEVLARYNAVNTQAQQVASTPFQVYSTNPNAFVAPLNETQQAGIANTNLGSQLAQGNLGLAGWAYGQAGQQAQPYINASENDVTSAQGVGNQLAGQAQGLYAQGLGAAQPFNQAANQNISQAQAGAQPYQQLATGLGLGAAQQVNAQPLTAANINQYMSPYLNSVVGSTAALLNQQNQQAMSGQTGNAIQQHAFGGDRAGIAAANLAQQQQLANANVFSSLLNQGYNNALSTAQQQQGLNLSAEQANRAALAAASGNLAAIGQQGFGQGLSAAQAQQSLGQQIYGQQTGTGQNLASLGQQQFGQGLSAAQQQAALGSQLFNQASTAGQNLQGLGLAQQSAELQGAQAQLAAGQMQQQTQQAGQTALYNQFLQQQSYPFQVAQFLANIAEGTGALSGSTTTTTQPGGFFSDVRLKEDVKPVGRTYDGQTIYSYKYKGDPRTQIGLLAQKVEGKHPEAVGESHGYKTVDYGKATEAAAERGHFKRGGLAGFADGGAPQSYGGLDPAVMQQILANAQGMYGPYLTPVGGLAPYGGGGARVPTANLPVGQLKTAGEIPKQASAFDQIGKAAQTGASLGEAAGKAGEIWRKYHPIQKPSDSGNSGADSSDPPYARGGLVPHGYADGGLPYEQQMPDQLNIPNEKPDLKLAKPGDAPGQDSGLDKVGKLADIAGTIAKIATMFHTGGMVERGHFADGGSPDTFSDSSGDDTLEGNSWRDRIASGLSEALADHDTRPAPTGDKWTFQPSAKGLGVVAANALNAPFHSAVELADLTHGGLGAADMGRGRTPTNLDPMARDFKTSGVNGPVDHAPAANVPIAAPPPVQPAPARHRGLGAAQTPAAAAPPVVTPLEAQTVPHAEAIGAPDTTGLASAAEQLPDHVQGPSRLDAVRNGLGALKGPVGGYFADLGKGDLPTWISLLSGIGAMGTAPTVHPGVALAAGLSGGTEGYMAARRAQIAQQQQQAHTQQTAAETTQEMSRNAPAGTIAVPGVGPNGKFFTDAQGKPWHYELAVNAAEYGATPPGTASAPGAAGAAKPAVSSFTPSSDTDAYMHSHFGVDPSQPGAANHSRAIAMNPELAAIDDAAHKSVQARIGNLGSLDTSQRQMLQLSEAINALPSGTLAGQGHGSEYRTRLVNIGVTAANMLGIPVDPSLTNQLSEQQIIAKIRTMMGPAIAQQNDERAASIAKAITGVLPGGDLSKQAANELLGQMMTQTQQPRDLSQYANEYVGRYGLAAGVEPAFQRDVTPRYGREAAALQHFMQTPAFPKAMADLKSPDPAVRERAIRGLDAIGGEGFHRYFTLGQ